MFCTGAAPTEPGNQREVLEAGPSRRDNVDAHQSRPTFSPAFGCDQVRIAVVAEMLDGLSLAICTTRPSKSRGEDDRLLPPPRIESAPRRSIAGSSRSSRSSFDRCSMRDEMRRARAADAERVERCEIERSFWMVRRMGGADAATEERAAPGSSGAV